MTDDAALPRNLTRRQALQGTGAGIAAAALGGITRPTRAQDASPVAAPEDEPAVTSETSPSECPIDYLVVFYMENHSFDNLYGLFPGANGVASHEGLVVQLDENDLPYTALPVALDTYPEPDVQDPRFPEGLPNAPYLLDEYVPMADAAPAPIHRYYTHILQQNGGKMDKFVRWTDSGCVGMGFRNTFELPLFPLAREYTLCDNFFTGAWGGSFLNHMWLVGAQTPVWPDAPEDIISVPVFDATGTLVGLEVDGMVTPDGYCINEADPFYPPFRPKNDDAHRLPPQTYDTIGDRLSAAGLGWAWYGEGWTAAETTGKWDGAKFQVHHQPFAYFEQFKPGSEARAMHLLDTTDFEAAIANGSLPAVSFVKPEGPYDEHAGYSTVQGSEEHLLEWIDALQASPMWERMAIIVTYDDFGGWYDHVPPPAGDRWGPGGRVPALVISPWAKRAHIDSTPYDTTSILRFIEWRWGLEPLTERDANANNLLPVFDFTASEGQ